MRRRRFSDPSHAEVEAREAKLREQREATQAALEARRFDLWIKLRGAAVRYAEELPHVERPRERIADAEAALKAAARAYVEAEQE